MERKTIVKHGRRVTKATLALLIGATVMTSCKDDDLILTGQPEWLGNSIYERLQEEGNYKYTLRLIDDLGETDVLSHTGSRTLFAASDSAYDAWFKSNTWGVGSYEQLTRAQKSLLLKNSMINNAYLLELMSNSKAVGDAATPDWGRTMRRETSLGIYDSVYVMPVAMMPNVPSWKKYRERGKAMPLFMDATNAPMIHFLPAYMQYNKMTVMDLNVLTNGRATSLNEAWVNGHKIIGSGDPSRKRIDYDITCKNGYIQKIDGVIESSPNMAQIIRGNANMQIWSHLLDRFSAPYYNQNLTNQYNAIYNTNDSAYVLRYFSKLSEGGRELSMDPDGKPVKAQISFDPGWNQYTDENTETDLHHDAGVMIVPTDSALNAWWNGAGSELQDEYKEWDSIPDATVAKLINVNMLSTFSEAVPSKFDNVLDDAKEKLGIKPEDVKGVYMGCNGVVYLVDKVFAPAEFTSVAYPALAHTSTMNIIYWAISVGSEKGATDYQKGQMNFLPYLLSMNTKYALILPTNEAFKSFYDPSTYGQSTTLKDVEGNDSVVQETPDVFVFDFDMTKPISTRVTAQRYTKLPVEANGMLAEGAKEASATRPVSVNANVLNTTFAGLMDQLIIVIPDKTKNLEDYVREGYNYFKTKGGAIVRATMVGGQLAFEGGYQMEHKNAAIPVERVYEKVNGTSYQVSKQVPMGSQKSLYVTLQEHPEFNSFLHILQNDYNDLLGTKLNNKYNAGMAAVGSQNLKLFDNYNYTVYIPTNEAIQSLQESKVLPTFDELDRGDFDVRTNTDPVLDSICIAEHWYTETTDETSKKNVRDTVASTLKKIVGDFVRYHVQDNAIAVGMAPELDRSNLYESMMRNPVTGRFYPIAVNYGTNYMTVTDELGQTHNVKTDKGLYNLVCREYWFESSGNNARLFMASNIVVHQIDGVLKYDNMEPWRTKAKRAVDAVLNK